MPDPLLDALARHPADKILLHDAGQSWCAAEVLAEVAQLSARLPACRVLAVLADNSPAWVIADLAALRSGTVHLPLPTFFSRAQMIHALEQTAADAVLTDQPRTIDALGLGFAVDSEWQGLTLMRRAVAAMAIPAGTAKVSFTSGSTGQPKGVCLSAAGLIDTVLALQERLADLPIERHLAVLPLSLLLENVAGVYVPLLRGAEVHLPALQDLGWRGMGGFDPARLDATVEAVRPDSLILVPELLKAWTIFLDRAGKQASPSLDYVAVGGARVDSSLLHRARTLGLPAYQGYGLTECGSVVCLNRPGDDGDDVGRPLGHVQIRIDSDELRIRARAFLGYLGDAALPATEFASGDLGAFNARGHLALHGRCKNLLITSFGRNISPEWVESVLLAQPAIAQAVVGGDARPCLNALLVPLPGAGSDALAQAVAIANAALPDYARIGKWSAVAPFTVQNGLATGNGRPRRAAILNHFAAEIAALYPDEESLNDVL